MCPSKQSFFGTTLLFCYISYTLARPDRLRLLTWNSHWSRNTFSYVCIYLEDNCFTILLVSAVQPDSAISVCVCVCVCVCVFPTPWASLPSCETWIHWLYSNYKHTLALVQLQSMSHVTLLKSRSDHGPPLRCHLWTRIKFSTWPQRASMTSHCFVYNHLPHHSWLCSAIALLPVTLTS